MTQLSGITYAELASHNTRVDCWHAYSGKVYNVTPFLKYHPGGVGEMMRAAGKDGEWFAWTRRRRRELGDETNTLSLSLLLCSQGLSCSVS